ncbi:MAG: minor capsid protein [Eubacteriales bacterium]|nr:minor capsid protein [Eubacteriales bacterium]
MVLNLYDTVLNDIISRIPEIGVPLLVGATPAENGVRIAWTGGEEKRYLHGAGKTTMTVVVNAKHELQLTALHILGQIHTALTSIRRFEPTAEYRIIGVQTQSAPAFAGREKSGQWVYVSSLAVTFATNRQEETL